MRITYDLLVKHGACEGQRNQFRELHPDGVEPTVAALSELAAHGLDVWWLYSVLPAEGPGSQRAYALWCAEQVAHLCSDERVEQCLQIVRRRVADPDSVSDEDLAAARAAASAAWDAASAAWDAAWDAARDAARDAQLGCLSALLLDAPGEE